MTAIHAGMHFLQAEHVRRSRRVSLPVAPVDSWHFRKAHAGKGQPHPVVVVLAVTQAAPRIERAVALDDGAAQHHALDADVVAQIQPDWKGVELLAGRPPQSERARGAIVEHFDRRVCELGVAALERRQCGGEVPRLPDVVFVEKREMRAACRDDPAIARRSRSAAMTAQIFDASGGDVAPELADDTPGGCVRMIVDDKQLPMAVALRANRGERIGQIAIAAVGRDDDAHQGHVADSFGESRHQDVVETSIIPAVPSAGSSPPVVSVVVPCFEQARFLPRALAGALAQDVPVEVVVVDDGSSDDVAGVCAQFDGVRCVRQPHRGLSAARNRGIEETHGALLHFLDADDAPGPGMYRALACALIAHPDWTAAVSRTRVMLEDGRPTTLELQPPASPDLFAALGRQNRFPPGAVLLRRAILQNVGMFDETLDSTADWDLWLRVARAGAVFGRVADCFFEYRTYSTSMSRRDPLAVFEGQREIVQRARRRDPRVTIHTRHADGLPGDDLADAVATCAASSLGVAIGHRRMDQTLAVLGCFVRALEGLCLMPHHLEVIVAEASITLGFVPPDRESTRRACGASLAAVHRAADGAAREIVQQVRHFLECGLLTDVHGEPIIPVPVCGSMLARVPIQASRISRLTTLIGPVGEPIDGTVRLRILDGDGGGVLREMVAMLGPLPMARSVSFAFDALDGFDGRSLAIELTPATNRTMAVYEPAAPARTWRRRVLRRLSLDRKGRNLYCRVD